MKNYIKKSVSNISWSFLFAFVLSISLSAPAEAVNELSPTQEMQLQQLNQKLLAVHNKLNSTKNTIRELEEELAYLESHKSNRIIGASVGYSVGTVFLYYSVLGIVQYNSTSEELGAIADTTEVKSAYRKSLASLLIPGFGGLLLGTLQQIGLKSDADLYFAYKQELQSAKMEKEEIEALLQKLSAEKRVLQGQ